MKKKNFKRSLIIMVVFAILSACNLPSSQEATPPPATQPPATELVTVVDTATSPPPTEIPILHTTIPVSLPDNRSGHAGDYDSSVTAEQKKSNGGDRFTFEQFERPFNANTMDVYFPNLDIIDTFVFQDDTWIYGTIQVVDRSAASSSPYRFAMQLDVHVDGKGDYLVVTENPSSTDWTVNGVQVYFDTNSDVGDLTAMFTDLDAENDGFETMLFDQGKGDDPDSAWARVSPDDPNTIQLAVKRSLVGNPPLYMVNMWTGHATLDPTLFDYSDHYTHEQAGAADPGLPNFYPIKEVYELDNSCRIAVGFHPSGNEPG
ncbi:MAG TPA: hypothetical protein VMJ90_03885, partial [Anaerolineales bacterium]|nr:hypothetical protein [Anaerolineales bacterium]